MFRFSTIIRELALNLAKVIFMLKHSVELRRCLLCGCSMLQHGCGFPPHPDYRPASSWVYYTTSCKHSVVWAKSSPETC